MSESKNLQRLMLLAAALMSKEEIVKKLREDIVKYDNAAGEAKEKAYTILEGDCLLLATKRITDTESMEDIENTMQQVASVVDTMDGKNKNKK